MNQIELTIMEIISEGVSRDGQTAWLKVKDISGFQVAFWGRPMKLSYLDKDMQNIEKINS